MKRVWIRWLVILASFVISIGIFSIILNQGTTDMTIEMQEATLPVVSIVYSGRSVNTMHGYVDRMDNGTMRDSISPIGENRELSFIIDSFKTGVNKVNYEIRNLDGSRLIEDTFIESFENRKGRFTGTINLKDLIERDREYNLNFVVGLDDGREVYYYTRIICNDDLEVENKLNFIFDFNNKTFAQSSAKELRSYMEPNSEADNTNLGLVTIHSNINQLGWGNTSPRVTGDIYTTIYDISNNMISAKLEYIVSVMAQGVNNYYRVEEDYTVREGKERYYLIDFNRTMSDILPAQKDSLVNNKIVLGIQKNVPVIQESSDGNIVAIENCNRLYSYDISANKFATLYSCYEAGDNDPRELYDKSKINILSVEETGNVTFMVYGYQNRGTHEGEVGVLVEYYNSILNTIEEQIFIKYDKSPEILIADVDKLCYLNNNRDLFVLIDGNIVQANLDSLESKVLVDDIIEDTLFISNSNRLAVWRSSEEPTADLNSIDLNDAFISTITKNPNECLKAIGYMNEDLILGVSYANEVINNAIGDITLPMSKLVIMSDYGAVLKEYTYDDIYIIEGTIVDNQVSLKRVRKTPEGSFVEIYDDQISYNESETNGKNTIKKVATETFEKIYQVELKKNVDTKTLKFLTPKEVLYEGGKKVELGNHSDRNRFFLYDKGHIKSIHDDIAIAVEKAYEARGFVVDKLGNEVYKRGETVARNQIMALKAEDMPEDKTSMSICLDAMLKLQGVSRNTEYMLAKGTKAKDILSDNLADAYVLNLTGCTMDVAFYYLNQDIPVMAVLNNGNTVLLIGYNEQNVVWYDPAIREIYKKGINDSRELFEANGNRFLTYQIKKE